MVILMDNIDKGLLYDVMNLAKSNVPNSYFHVRQKIPNLSTLVKENFNKTDRGIFKYVFGNKININFDNDCDVDFRVFPKNFLSRRTSFIELRYGGIKQIGQWNELVRAMNPDYDGMVKCEKYLNSDNYIRLIVFNYSPHSEHEEINRYTHRLRDLFLKKLK